VLQEIVQGHVKPKWLARQSGKLLQFGHTVTYILGVRTCHSPSLRPPTKLLILDEDRAMQKSCQIDVQSPHERFCIGLIEIDNLTFVVIAVGRRRVIRANRAKMKRKSFALISGASRGLGEAFARELAARKQNVILVARSKDKLECLARELRRSHSVAAEVLDSDVASPFGAAHLTQKLYDSDLQVDLLINNAGFGLRGEFQNLTLEQQRDMVRLNNLAVIELTYLLLPRLLQSSQSGIINVASTAGFQPMPYAALYGATKSFLISFSMALQEELRNQGVSVVTLCPGQIRVNSPKPKNGFRKSGFLYQSPERVVHAALETLAGGGGTVIPGFLNKFSAFVQRLLPRRIVPKLVAKMSRS
jgi:uncharacterized protein